jgi:hypothetical protein
MPILINAESEQTATPVEEQPENSLGNVVFISSDNKKLHVGNVEHIIAHLEIADNLDEFRQASFDIFDRIGRPLKITELDDGEVALELVDALQEEVDEKQQQLLVDRMSLTLAGWQVDAHTHPDTDLRDFRLPIIIQASLPVVVAGLAEAFELDKPNDTSNSVSKCHDAGPHPHFP